jgi:succinate dehydrogenase flavin-adding protein (antitoxin of CptAB toxin-antitoxin module)
MRELDDLLLRYLDNRYDAAPDADKEAFQALLALSDPELVGYLLNKERPAPELQRVVEHILERPET